MITHERFSGVGYYTVAPYLIMSFQISDYIVSYLWSYRFISLIMSFHISVHISDYIVKWPFLHHNPVPCYLGFTSHSRKIGAFYTGWYNCMIRGSDRVPLTVVECRLFCGLWVLCVGLEANSVNLFVYLYFICRCHTLFHSAPYSIVSYWPTYVCILPIIKIGIGCGISIVCYFDNLFVTNFFLVI